VDGDGTGRETTGTVAVFRVDEEPDRIGQEGGKRGRFAQCDARTRWCVGYIVT
jgi:hypothetical protein